MCCEVYALLWATTTRLTSQSVEKTAKDAHAGAPNTKQVILDENGKAIRVNPGTHRV
jgi:hypothetical protein